MDKPENKVTKYHKRRSDRCSDWERAQGAGGGRVGGRSSDLRRGRGGGKWRNKKRKGFEVTEEDAKRREIETELAKQRLRALQKQKEEICATEEKQASRTIEIDRSDCSHRLRLYADRFRSNTNPNTLLNDLERRERLLSTWQGRWIRSAASNISLGLEHDIPQPSGHFLPLVSVDHHPGIDPIPNPNPNPTLTPTPNPNPNPNSDWGLSLIPALHLLSSNHIVPTAYGFCFVGCGGVTSFRRRKSSASVQYRREDAETPRGGVWHPNVPIVALAKGFKTCEVIRVNYDYSNMGYDLLKTYRIRHECDYLRALEWDPLGEVLFLGTDRGIPILFLALHNASLPSYV